MYRSLAGLVVAGCLAIFALGAAPLSPAGSLDETRIALSKWIETQQIITRERNDWQQSREILLGRIDLVQKEITSVEEQIKKGEAGVAEARKKRDDVQKENSDLVAIGKTLADAATELEGEIRKLHKQLPPPIQEKIAPLYTRIPADAAATGKVATGERYQNIVGILNEINKANGEISVSYEVRDAAEVKVVYLGLAQAYYVDAKGNGGISRPTPDGWKSETHKEIAPEILKALEIIQGKQTASFVPLPVKMQ
jgi:hypothetical protein